MHHLRQTPLPLIAKIAVLLFIFGVFPAFIAVVAINYKHKAEMVLEAKNPGFENKSSEASVFDTGAARILTDEQAKTLQRARSLLVGKWVSLQDRRYIVELLPNNTFTDKDGGTLVAYGTWGNFVSATSSSNTQLDPSSKDGGVNNNEASYYLAKVHYEDKYRNEKFIYEIMQLDEDRVILYYTGNSKILYFVRAEIETAAASSTEIKQ